GRPNAMYTHKASQIGSANNPNNVRYLRYQYDNHNNVTQRYDDQLGITDRWTYDALDRVKTNTIALNDKDQHGLNNPDLTGPKTFEYDTLGNLTYQTDIGAYQYGTQAGPHAVTKANGLTYQYDKVGNLQRAYTDTMTERSMSWSSFNKPTQIVRDGNTVTFAYDAEHNRYKKTSSDGTDTVYFGNFYERVTNTTTGEIQHKHFVYADGKLIALNTQTTDAEHNLKNKQVRYLHYDALNSVDLITDGYGLVVERRSYDTWGKQRHVVWQTGSAEEVIQEAITNRGYTGHEEITEVGLIHMNGRVYDPELARFTSADPMVQDPYQVNSFNRYAYVQNNPLKYTDPTGFTAEENSSTSGDDGASAGGPESGNGGDNGKSDDSKDSKEENEQQNTSATSTGIDPDFDPTKPEPGLINTFDEIFDFVWDFRGIADSIDSLNVNSSWVDKGFTIASGFIVAKYKKFDKAADLIDGVAPKLGKFDNALPDVTKNAGAVKQGIYEFTDTAGKKYVGQSVNMPNRLKQHVKTGKLDPNQSVKTTEVLGGKTAREIAEHKRIQEITGGVPARFSDKVSNKVDPIGPNRRHFLD
ncbi:RHS repeat-associated core domain-containing protein, partial [Vibrio parahaemolyticus]|nr:RHS repeat-associated core domain-containing protein [Vibrio parahaemolyticus]